MRNSGGEDVSIGRGNDANETLNESFFHCQKGSIEMRKLTQPVHWFYMNRRYSYFQFEKRTIEKRQYKKKNELQY